MLGMKRQLGIEDLYREYYDGKVFSESDDTLRRSWERLSRFEAQTGVRIGMVDRGAFASEMRVAWMEIAGIALVKTLMDYEAQPQCLYYYAAEQIFTRQYLLDKALSEMWVTMATYNQAPRSAASEQRSGFHEGARGLVVSLLAESGIDSEIGARVANRMYSGVRLPEAGEHLALVGAKRLNLDCNGLPITYTPPTKEVETTKERIRRSSLSEAEKHRYLEKLDECGKPPLLHATSLLLPFIGQVYCDAMAWLANVRLRCPRSPNALYKLLSSGQWGQSVISD